MANDRPTLLASVGGTRGRPDLNFWSAVLGSEPRRCYVLGTREHEIVCEEWSLETGERLARTVLDEVDRTTVQPWITGDPDHLRVLLWNGHQHRVGMVDLRTATLTCQATLTPYAHVAHVSRDGRTWVVHGRLGHNDPFSLLVDGQYVRALPYGRCWATSRDSRRLACWENDDGKVWVIDTDTGAEVAAFAAEGAEQGVVALCFAGDDATLWAMTYDHRVVVWSLDTRALRARWVLGHEAMFLAVSRDGRAALFDDGRAFALGAAEPVNPGTFSWSACCENMAPDGSGWVAGDAVLRWHELATGRTTDLFDEGHTGPVQGFATTIDGTTLASCGDDSTIYVRDVATLAPRWTLEGSASRWNKVAFAPDGRTLFAARSTEEKGCVAWDVATGVEVEPRHPETGAPLKTRGGWDEISPTSRLSTARAAWTLPDTGELPQRPRWSADGRFLLSLERIEHGVAAHFYRCGDALELYRRVELQLVWGQLAAAMGSRMCAFGTVFGQVVLLDHTTGVCVELFPRHHASVTALHISPDESRLFVGSCDGLVRVFKT